MEILRYDRIILTEVICSREEWIVLTWINFFKIYKSCHQLVFQVNIVCWMGFLNFCYFDNKLLKNTSILIKEHCKFVQWNPLQLTFFLHYISTMLNFYRFECWNARSFPVRILKFYIPQSQNSGFSSNVFPFGASLNYYGKVFWRQFGKT